MTNVVIMGSGFGGIMFSNHLRKEAAKKNISMNITVIGKDDKITYQPGLLFIPFQKRGYRQISDLEWPVERFIHKNVHFHHSEIVALDRERRKVITKDGEIPYDWVVVALGAKTVLDDYEVDGIATQFRENPGVQGFYTPKHAIDAAQALERFKGGDVVVDVASIPYKCPVAPLEFAFLLDDYFTKKGLRSVVNLTITTPLSGAFTKPICNDVLSYMLTERGINVVTDFQLAGVGDDYIESPTGQTVHSDLSFIIPPHEGSNIVEDSGLGNGIGFGVCDIHSLQSRRDERVFFLGDVADVPTSKAGSVAHFQAEIVLENLLNAVRGKELTATSDGHANCFIVTGYGKAILVDFNYEIQPVSGKFPLPVIGPMSLLKESYINYFGKLAFKYVFLHLLHGHPMPLITSQMSHSGKDFSMLEKYK